MKTLESKSKVGCYTTWNLGLSNKCIWYGCTKKPVKGKRNSLFCKEHGEHKIKGQIV